MKHRTSTKSSGANQFGMWLGGATLGALAMYFSDPERGRRRRALTRDKFRSMATRSGNAVEVAMRDLGNRAQGLRAKATHMVRPGGEVDDPVLAARVRARIGRAIVHSHPINVMVRQGCVILSGPVLANEKDALVKAVHHVDGVREVEDRLTVHETPEGVPALQGNHQRTSAAQGSWPPGLRALATAGAGVLALYGMRRRGTAGTLMSTAGLGLLARSLSNRPLWGNDAGKQVIHLNKTQHIVADREKVFDIWSDFKSFPYFMSNVKEVRDLGNGRSRWVVHGPAGMDVEWEAEVTESRRPEKLAWRTVEGAPVQHSGEVHFEEELTGTRVSVHLTYHPPAGTVGHAAATLLGSNPKKRMDEDLMRMKSYIESGIPPHDAAKPFPPLGVQPGGQEAGTMQQPGAIP